MLMVESIFIVVTVFTCLLITNAACYECCIERNELNNINKECVAVPVQVPPSNDYEDSHNYNNECPICLDEFDNDGEGVYILNCNHMFHEKCIMTWFQHSRKVQCPFCLQQ